MEQIIIAIGVIIIFVLLIVLVIVRQKYGNKKQYNPSKIIVHGGKSVELDGGEYADRGLRGFMDNRRGTLLTGLEDYMDSARVSAVKICLVHIVTGATYEAEVTGELLIGRKNIGYTTAYLEIPDSSKISKKHAMLSRFGDQLYIQDMGSANHTWINGNMVFQKTAIKSGDILKLGSSQYRIQIQYR